MTGSQAVVLDRADLLDADSRAGMVRMVERVTSKLGIAVLLCSTGVGQWERAVEAGHDSRRDDAVTGYIQWPASRKFKPQDVVLNGGLFWRLDDDGQWRIIDDRLFLAARRADKWREKKS